VVKLIKDGKPIAQFCIHPETGHALPIEDWAIAQKLMLETDEALLLKTANRRELIT
jgi:hypothetical protein